jgi:hypothetical protein
MASPVEPFGFAIFCEDVRSEIGGQYSLIGIYPDGLRIHTPFPVTIPKFSVSITFCEPHDIAVKRNFPISLNIYLPGESEPSLRGEFPVPGQQVLAHPHGQLPLLDLSDEDSTQMRIMVINMTIAQLVLPAPGYIRVRAQYEGKIIRLGTFKVLGGVEATTKTNQDAPNIKGDR